MRRPELLQADPENRLLGRANRRRLDFEALRDALLAVGGQARPQRWAAGRWTCSSQAVRDAADASTASSTGRTCPARSARSTSPAPTCTARSGSETTVPQQALFLMNSPFVAEQAKALAARREVAWPFDRRREGDGGSTALSWAATRPPTRSRLAREFVGRRPGTSSREPDSSGRGSSSPRCCLLSNEFAFVD